MRVIAAIIIVFVCVSLQAEVIQSKVDLTNQQPGTVAIAPDGTLFFVDSDMQRILKVDQNGFIISELDLSFSFYYQPESILLSSNGDMFISGINPARIDQYTQDGSHQNLWILDSTGLDIKPGSMALGPNEKRLYVIDNENKDIIQIQLNDGRITRWKVGVPMNQITIDTRGDIYLTADDVIFKYTPQGEMIKVIEITDALGLTDMVFHDLEVSENGILIVSDTSNALVLIIDQNGTILGVMSGASPGQPTHIAKSKKGNIWIMDESLKKQRYFEPSDAMVNLEEE